MPDRPAIFFTPSLEVVVLGYIVRQRAPDRPALEFAPGLHVLFFDIFLTPDRPATMHRSAGPPSRTFHILYF